MTPTCPSRFCRALLCNVRTALHSCGLDTHCHVLLCKIHDRLEVGTGMTEDQDRAHFTMWCILASPLISGNDPRTQSAATTAILTNRLAIAVNQDKLGRQAVVVQGSNASASQVFAKPLADGSVAVPDVLKPYMGGAEKIEAMK